MNNKGHKGTRKVLLAACAAFALTPTAAWAQPPERGRYDIAAQDLGTALTELARQSNREIYFSADLTRGKHASQLRGNLTFEEALSRLLANSGLRYRVNASGSIVVEAAGTAPLGAGKADPGSAVSDQVAEAGATEEIVVTGSNIRGVNVSAPTITMTRKEFENTGFSAVEELFESLPQNFDEVTPEGRFANEGGSQLRGANNGRVSAVDLRGLGAQSTLTLLNGNRRAGSIDGRVVDISVIPLSIIERVEVVTGGRSAIYGADAVAGVVNLVTRRDFDGAESQAYFGFAPDGGGERLQLGQIVGANYERGGFVAAYDFARDWPLELGDVGLLSFTPHPEVPLIQLKLNAQTEARRHSGFLSGRFDLSDNVEIFGDALYSRKKFEDSDLLFLLGADDNSFRSSRSKAEHLSFAGGARVDMGDDWKLKLSGAWSSATNKNLTSVFFDFGGGDTLEGDFSNVSKTRLATVSAVADGPLFSIGGITPRAALGVEWRREDFKLSLDGIEDNNADRTVRSAFAELFIPLVEDSEATGLRRLEVTIAGRYDEYSDFGGTFNPQAGISWEPVRGLTFRGSYSRAFRAPALSELGSSVDAFLEPASDPTQGGAFVPILFTQGQIIDLGPEKAETWSAGFDYAPPFAPWLRTSVSYFNVRYNGRIEQPSINGDRELVLERADRFPGLIVRNPTAEQIAAILDSDADGFIDNDLGVPFDPETQNLLDVFPNVILFDNRTRNIATEEVRGLDFTIDTNFDTRVGKLNFGVNLTHTLDHDRQLTKASPAFGLLNEVGKPVDTRVRATAGWTKGPFSAFTYLNYVDDYANPFSTPPSRMESWTTVDLTLRFNGSELADRGFLKGFDATLSVRNLFDNDPPVFPNSFLGILYDSTNASAIGRFLSLRLTKHW